MSQPSARYDAMQQAEYAPRATPGPSRNPMTAAPAMGGQSPQMPQAPFDPKTGQNVFGITSPMQAMSGGDPQKQKGIEDYYQGIASSAPQGSPEQLNAQGIMHPNTAQSPQLLQFLRQLMQPQQSPQQQQFQPQQQY